MIEALVELVEQNEQNRLVLPDSPPQITLRVITKAIWTAGLG